MYGWGGERYSPPLPRQDVVDREDLDENVAPRSAGQVLAQRRALRIAFFDFEGSAVHRFELIRVNPTALSSSTLFPPLEIPGQGGR